MPNFFTEGLNKEKSFSDNQHNLNHKGHVLYNVQCGRCQKAKKGIFQVCTDKKINKEGNISFLSILCVEL